MRLSAALLLLILVTGTSSAQFYKDKESFKIGVIFGSSTSQTFGTELKNPTQKIGLNCGIYFRTELSTSIHGEVELLASFKGSKYQHNLVDKHYEYLSMITMDLPLIALFDLQKNKQKHFLLAGVSPSYLLQSEFFLSDELTPRDEFRDVGFKKYDASLLLGYHLNTYYTGWQIYAQYGLLNINDGLELEGVLPNTGTGGSVQNFSVNLKMFF